jgi:cytidylate kinase
MKNMEIHIEGINTIDQLVDQFTKGLSVHSFCVACKKLMGWLHRQSKGRVEMLLTTTVHQQMRLTRLKLREITIRLFRAKYETHTCQKDSNPNIKPVHIVNTPRKHSRN